MWVRTSTRFYSRFILDMDRSPGFGSASTNYFALFRLGFPSAPVLHTLTLHVSITRRTVLQKVRCRVVSLQIRSSTACKHRVSGSLSLPSRGPFHLSITVLFAIAHLVVFRLGGWSPRLPARFPVSRGTLDPARCPLISLTGLSPSLAGFPNTILLSLDNTLCSPQPQPTVVRWFGLYSFRSPLL